MRCGLYSFGPNRLHYCGPDANKEMFDYLKEGLSNPGLEVLLRKFETLYPYLKKIAWSNDIKDPFDERVVEAYWIGNELLDGVSKKELYQNLLEDHGLKKKLTPKEFSRLKEKIDEGALPHHSFHVFNIWKRTGHMQVPHTLESMDECRIGWGKTTEIDGPYITIKTRPLKFLENKLALGEETTRRIVRRLDNQLDDIKKGDIITVHWGSPCEIITKKEALMLERFTLLSIRLANKYL